MSAKFPNNASVLSGSHVGMWLTLGVLCATSARGQTTPPAATPPAPTETRVLFSTAIAERTTTDSIIIQTGDDAVLVFDAPGPFTLFDPTSKKAKNLIVIAKHAMIEAATVIRSYDATDAGQRPLQIPDMATAGNGKDGTDADHCQRGGNGTLGLQGKDGTAGSPGYNAPLIIIDISKLEGTQTLTIQNRGGTGGQGQNGQRGGDGGRGGRGGDGVDHLTDCACGPGEAGTPGVAGGGGRGGPGGVGAPGGTILLSASIQGLNKTGGLLNLVVTAGDPGAIGNGGAGGKGGRGNQGGGGSTYCSANNVSSKDMADMDSQINSRTQDALPVSSDGLIKVLMTSAWK
jgi:hypothetical protein